MFQFSEEQKKEELRCRRRNKGESLRELAHDIRRLMTLAYQENSQVFPNTLHEMHFCLHWETLILS